MNAFKIPAEQKKSARIYLIMMVSVLLILLLFRSPEKVLNISISSYNNPEQPMAILTYLPQLSLPKGTYEFQLSGGSGSGKISILSIDGTTYGESFIAESGAVVAVSLDRDVSNLLIRTESDDPSSAPSFSQVRILSETPIYTDSVLVTLLVLMGLLVGGYVKYLCPEAKRTDAILFVLVTGAAIIASYPLFTSYLYDGHDLNFHLWRIEGIKDGLLSGQFPVRVHPTHNNGYGYITASVYPELFLYFPAVLRILGVSSIMAYKTFLFAMNLATSWIMYYTVRQINGSKSAAGLAAIIYTLSTWRLGNAYHRAAIGEALSMTFFPLAVLGMHYILKGNKSKWYVLTIACTCIFQSHVISTVLLAILIVVMSLIFIKELFLKKASRFWALCKAGILTVLVNLWYLVPFAYYYFSLDLAIRQPRINTAFFNYAIIPAQLFNVFHDVFGYSQFLSQGIHGEMSLTLGVGVTLCLMVGLLYYLFHRKKDEQDKFQFCIFAVGLALTLMASTLFPWEEIQQTSLINKFAGTVRMPWRFLSLASPLLCISGATIIAKWSQKEHQKTMFISICILCTLAFVIFGSAFTTTFDMHMRKGMAVPESRSIGWDREYLLTTTDTNALTPNLYQTSEDSIRVTEYEKRGSNIVLTVSGAKDGAYIEVPLLYYPGYGAKDDQNQKLTVVSGQNDVVRVLLYENTTRVRIFYQGLPGFKAATIASVLTLIVVAVHLCLRRKSYRAA